MPTFFERVYLDSIRQPPLPSRWYQNSELGAGGAVAVVTGTSLTVPAGYDFILHSLQFHFLPGAAQFLVSWYLNASRALGEPVFYIAVSSTPVVSVAAVQTWQGFTGEAFFPSGSVLQPKAVFNSGGAANNVDFHWRGLLIAQSEILA